MMRKLLLVLGGLGFIGLAVWVVRGQLTRSEPVASDRSGAASVTEPAPRVVTASGRIEPVSEEVVLAAELSGRLVALPVEEGAAMRKGEVLARLDDREYRTRLDSAIALQRQKEAELLRLKNGSRAQERREARALMEEAQAVVDNARTERDRRAALFQTGDIAREEVERAERQLEVARARHAAAAERHSLIDATARVEDIARAEAELSLAGAGVEAARILLDKTVIRSPLDGVVLRRHLRIGEIVASGPGGAPTPILTIADISRLRVRAEIDELDVGMVRSGQTAWITIDAFGRRRFNGRVERVGAILGRKTLYSGNPAEKNDTKILETRIDLDSIDDPLLRPQVGLRVNVFIDTGQ
ncbi:MAG: HlyD family secretion protein [Blastocatellia bacterium]|jgi:HlyD family secretion protein